MLIGLSLGAIAACAMTMVLGKRGGDAILLGAALFGFTTIYSVSSVHAHDFAQSDQRVELSAAQMFLYAVGAVVSPIVASAIITVAGPGAMFAFISLSHLLLVIFGLVRMRARPGGGRTMSRCRAPPS